MEWEAIGAVGEVLGALGVMATLAYLAIQTRQTGRMVRAQTTHQMSESIRDVMLAFTNRDFSEAMMGLDDDPEPHQELMAVGWVFAATRSIETQYYMQKDGVFDTAIWDAWRKQVPYIYRAQWAKDWWSAGGRSYFTEEFSTYMDAMLDQAPVPHLSHRIE